MSILIKASFENNDGEIIYRRLSIPRDGLNYELLKHCIAETFIISQPNLKYQDDEGDKITLHSDIELEEALRQLDESNTQILKIFVTEHAQTFSSNSLQSPEFQPPKAQSTTQVHIPEPEYTYDPPKEEEEEEPTQEEPTQEEPKEEEPEQKEQEVQEEFLRTPVEDDNLIVHGIYCDACGFPIIGIRWKCSICPETNYCESCEQIVNHMEEHPLLRIKVPLPPQRYSSVQRENVPPPNPTRPPRTTSTGSENSSVWGEFQKVLTQPQVVKATNVAKKLSSDVTQMISTVSDQLFTQTKEVSMDLGEKVSQNTSKLIEMCQNLTLSPEAKPTTPVNDLDCPYKRELAILEEMGFKSRAYNGFLLNKHKGNLQNALAELLP